MGAPSTADDLGPVPWTRLAIGSAAVVAYVLLVATVANLLRSEAAPLRFVCVVGLGLLLGGAVWRLHQVAFPPTERHRPAAPSRALAFLAFVDLGIVALLVPGLGDVPFVAGAVVTLVALSFLVSEGRRLVRSRPAIALVPLVPAVVTLLLAAIVPGAALVVLAAVLTVLAADLGSEWAIARAPASPSARWIGGAAVCTLAGAGAIRVFGANWGHVGIVVVVLVLIAAACAIDGDLLALVLAVAGLLVVAAVPTDDVPFDRDLRVEPGEGYMLVLGDSYTSGEGAEDYLEGTNTISPPEDEGGATREGEPTSQCRRSPEAWALRLARAGVEGVPDRVDFEACSGDVTERIPDQVARHVARGLDPPELVVVGVGGNDVGFSDIGAACVGPGSCVDVAEHFTVSAGDDQGDEASAEDLLDEPLADVADDLRRAYRSAIEVADGGRVVAVPYPIPIRNGAEPCFGALLDGPERDFVVTFVRALNETIEEVAADLGIDYLATMEDALEEDRLRLCDRITKGGINFLAFNAKTGSPRTAFEPGTWTHNSFHPNERGHEAMAAAAEEWFAGRPTAPEATTRDRDELARLVAAAGPGTTPQDGWVDERLRDTYRVVVVPVLLVAGGAWLALCQVVAAHRHRRGSGSPGVGSEPPSQP